MRKMALICGCLFLLFGLFSIYCAFANGQMIPAPPALSYSQTDNTEVLQRIIRQNIENKRLLIAVRDSLIMLQNEIHQEKISHVTEE